MGGGGPAAETRVLRFGGFGLGGKGIWGGRFGGLGGRDAEALMKGEEKEGARRVAPGGKEGSWKLRGLAAAR